MKVVLVDTRPAMLSLVRSNIIHKVGYLIAIRHRSFRPQTGCAGTMVVTELVDVRSMKDYAALKEYGLFLYRINLALLLLL